MVRPRLLAGLELVDREPGPGRARRLAEEQPPKAMPLVVPLRKLGVTQVDDHAANPAEATATTVAIARSTSSSSPGSWPSTQPVRISSSAP